MYRSNALQFNDFSKTVLEWDFDTLSKPLIIASATISLPKAVDNIQEYYHNFLPFILEEARAIISNGLEQIGAKAFDLYLNKQANLPRTKGNPMSLDFRGAIPTSIEHGNSMNVLLLTTTGISPIKKLIALVTEKPDASELFAKIIVHPEDYHAYQRCFTENSKWKAHYLASIVSEQRMYDACLEATEGACVQQIANATISRPSTIPVSTPYCNMDRLNLSQKEAIYAFMNAQNGSTLLLEGPPGTGKTSTLITLLKQLTTQNARTLVSAHSNKGVQVLALRALEEMPDTPMILVGVASKLPDKLQPIFLQGWQDMILSSFTIHYQKIVSFPNMFEIDSATKSLISDIERNIHKAEQALNRFRLIALHPSSDAQRKELYELSTDPLLASDFRVFYDNIAQLKSQPQSKPLWTILVEMLNRFIGKWKSIQKDLLEQYLLNHASIIFSTLISTGRKNMLTMNPVDYLLIDEAAQSVEAATLIPMRFKPSKVLLVGDTQQLPATVISPALDDSDKRYSTHYKWSMMWRLIQEKSQPALMLDIQYRMHPHICQWPSEQYYANRLTTAPTILPMPMLDSTGITSRPYAIYQVKGQAKKHESSNSTFNTLEAEYVVKIIKHIRLKNRTSTIGVITPYAEQKRLISDMISHKKYLQELLNINTVDGYQGDERDIIIISFTRTHLSEFLKEFRRLNVAITRAKFCLIILAAPSLLYHDIGQLVADAKLRQVLYSENELSHILQSGQIAANRKISNINTDLGTMAWQGNPLVQLQYAKTLSNKLQAIVWYRRAAENNNAEAQFYIGNLYFSGNDFLRRDIQLGLAWLNKAAQQHFPFAQYFLGKHCIFGSVVVKNIPLGIQYCEHAASSHLTEAMVFLAKLYDEGKEIPKNPKLAAKYYRLAAKQDHLESIEKLASLLSLGTLDNQKEALEWYRNIAVRNIESAYYPLAHLLHKVFNKQTEANQWYLKAAEQGNSSAQYELALRFKNGTDGCAVNIKRSNHFFQQAAHAGHMDSQFIYAGILKTQGQESESIHFLKLAYESCIEHCFEARLRLACLLLREIQSNSQGSEQELKSTAEQYQRPVELLEYYIKHYSKERLAHTIEQYLENLVLNSPFRDAAYDIEVVHTQSVEANYLLGRIFQEGIGVNANINRALQHYQLAVLHPDASYRAGYIYESGLGVDKNIANAKACYKNAANQGHELATKRLTWSYWLSTKKDYVPDDETLKKTKSRDCVMM